MKTRLLPVSARLLAAAAFLVTGLTATAGASPEGASPSSSSTPVTLQQARAALAPPHRSLLFVANASQFDSRVRFQVRGGGGMWWFTDDALWLTVLKHDDRRPTTDDRMPPAVYRPPSSVGVHLKLTFPGLSPTTHLVASDPQPSKTNYFLGSDASQWRSNVSTYASLRWEGVYPSVNLVFGQTGAGLGLTVESASDAALAALRLRVEGADGVRVDAADRLVADTAIGPVPLPPLLTRDGTPLHPTVAGDSITFATHPFNPFPESVDSPTSPADDPSDLLYSTYLGGSDFDIPYDIALGPDSSIYVAGVTWSSDFPITPGAFDPSCELCINGDAFVSRLSANGSSLVYSTYLGGSNQDRAYSLALGSDGTAYITGYTWSSDFPTTPTAFQTSCSGNCQNTDAFVTKLSADGSALVYSSFLGGRNNDNGWGITVSADGRAYVTGYTYSRDFPITPNAYDPTCGTDGRCNPYSFTTHSDAFVTQVSADGSALVYSSFLGGSDNDCAYRCYIALGGDGSMYLAGNTCSSDFPTTPGAYDTSFNGASFDCSSDTTEGDVYITKLSADGSTLVYSTYLGGSNDEWSNGIALGADSSVYVAGGTYSSDFPTTPGAYDPTCHSCPNAAGFVSRLTADGSALVYSTFLGGSSGTDNLDVAVGADGAAYVTGDTDATDFPITPGAFQVSCIIGVYGCDDAYLTKLSADGSALVYSTYLGGTGGEGGYNLTLDPSGAAYITGPTNSTDFPTSPDAFDPSYNGGEFDAFITRMSPDLVRMYVSDISPFYRPRGSRYLVGARITVRDDTPTQDATSTLVSGAAVTVDITLPDGRQLTFTNTTNTTGRVIFRQLVSDTGTYTFTVTNMTKYGWLYDPSLNVETSDSITIP